MSYLVANPEDRFSCDVAHFTVLNDVHNEALGTYEPRHDKTNKMSVRPAKTQISLSIRPI